MQTRAGTERYELLLRSYYMERQSHGHDPFGAGTMLFADFVERWMRDYVEPTNRFSSRRSKQTAMRQYLLPAFGHLPLKGITEVVIDPFIAKWRAGGLSAKTTNNLLSVLRTCLASAVRWRLLDRLPAMRTLKAPMPGYRFLSEDESRRLVQAAPSGYWRVFIVFLLHTGCRFGEAAAVRWDDLELEGPNARVRIERGVSMGIVGPTKNGRVRDIPLTREVVDHLRALPRTSAYVFALLDGSLPRSAQACKYLYRFCERAGIRRISWHVLRHTFATELSERQVPLRAVQELLGHASIVMTSRYAHVADRALQQAISHLPTLEATATECDSRYAVNGGA